ATQPSFQEGSTAKLFTLTAALEQGIPTSTTFNSPACIYVAGMDNPPYTGQCPSSDVPGVPAPFGQAFVNAGDSEACTCNMATGTSGSVNTYFVQLEKKAGIPNVRNAAVKLGVRSPLMQTDKALI